MHRGRTYFFAIGMAVATAAISCLIVRFMSSAEDPSSSSSQVFSASSTIRASSRKTPDAPAEVKKTTTMVTRSILEFGAVANDGLDDTAAIQQTIDAVSRTGGGVVRFPTGTYLVSINSQMRSSSAITIRSNVTLEGEGSANSVIRLAKEQGNYDSLFGAETPSTSVSNFTMTGLAIDSNGSNNPVQGEQDLQGSGLFRYALRIYKGENIRIERNRFFDQIAVNTISLNGSEVRNVTVSGNRFDAVGGGNADFDHSTIYIDATGATISNNTFSTRYGAGTKGARAAIEIHGSNHAITGNVIDGYLYGINVAGITRAGISDNQVYRNNVIRNVAAGFQIWSSYQENPKAEAALSNVKIQENQISINVSGWQGFFDGEPRSGIVFEPNRNAGIRDIDIFKNEISFSTFENAGSADYFSSGITLWKYENPDAYIQGIRVRDNKITNSLGPGIYFDSWVDGAEITGNQIVNPGQSRNPIDDIHRTAIYLTNSVANVQVDGNKMIDLQAINTMKAGIIEQTTCLGQCLIRDNELYIESGAGLDNFRLNATPRGAAWQVNPSSAN